MADNLCGPSTALKSFSEHTNRDRSLHQDRPTALPGRPGPSTFRSLPAGPSNDAEVRAFAAGAPFGLQPEAVPMPSALDLAMAGPPAFPVHPAHPPPPPGMYAPHPAAAGPSGLAMGHVSAPNQATMMRHSHAAASWATEFSAMQQQGPGLANLVALRSPGPAPGMAAAAFGGSPSRHDLHLHRLQQRQQEQLLIQQQYQEQFQQFLQYEQQLPQQQSVLGTREARGLTPEQLAEVQAAMAPKPGFVLRPMLRKHISRDGKITLVPIRESVAGLSDAQLEARFAQVEADADFKSEMDAWMATYGPSAEERQAQPQQGQGDRNSPTSTSAAQQQEAKDASAVMEALAGELEAQRLEATEEPLLQSEPLPSAEALEEEQQNQRLAEEQRQQEQEEQKHQDELDNLARTAERIVGVLDSHPAARFRESNFINLMRRIQRREVRLRGEDLIDETTGQPVMVVIKNESGDADGSSNNESSPALA